MAFFLKNDALHRKNHAQFSRSWHMKLVRLFQQNGFKANDVKEQGRNEIYRSIWSCSISTNSITCILSGFPWHADPCQMDSLDNCLDSLLFVVIT